MLPLIRTPTRILDHPSVVATIKRASSGGVAAAICHDTTYD